MRFVPVIVLACLAKSASAQCSQAYTQSVTLNGNQLSASFTPTPGTTIPTYVDLHISKNCPGNPTPSTAQCATTWYQPPFDEPYAINLHAAGVGDDQYSMTGASFDGKTFSFNLDISKVSLGASDELCYDFTYVHGSTGCDTGVCSLAAPTSSGFALLPTSCSALTYSQDLAVTGSHIVAHLIPDAGKPTPTWVDLHVSKNCPGSPVKSNSTCATPWYQPPFDEAYALNLHAASSATEFSTPGASFVNGEFTFDFDATTLTSTFSSTDELCYDFTYAYGNLGCDSGVCSLVEAAPSTSPIEVPAQPTCSQGAYTQSVKVTGSQVLAEFTPAAGATVPTFVDFHISKNCPNSPTPSSSQCATAWYQPPFDLPYALNLHSSAIGTYSSAGASYNANTNTFTFIFDASVLTNTLSASDSLCYDFTYVYGNYGCDTGVCAISSESITSAPTAPLILTNGPTGIQTSTSAPTTASASTAATSSPTTASTTTAATSSPTTASTTTASTSAPTTTSASIAPTTSSTSAPTSASATSASTAAPTTAFATTAATSSPTTASTNSTRQSCCIDPTCTKQVSCPGSLKCCEDRPVWLANEGGYCYDPSEETCASCPVLNPNHPEQTVCEGTNQQCCGGGCQDASQYQCCHNYGTYVAKACPIGTTCCGINVPFGQDPTNIQCCASGESCQNNLCVSNSV